MHEAVLFRRENEPQICVKTLQDHGGKRRRCYHFCYQSRQDFRVKFLLQSTWRRGESNPCFLRLRPLRSKSGFIREDSERESRHGNAWMALDVISFVIGWPLFGDIRNRNSRQPVFVIKNFCGSSASGRMNRSDRSQKTKDTKEQKMSSLSEIVSCATGSCRVISANRFDKTQHGKYDTSGKN
jgi:hypothetical protein